MKIRFQRLWPILLFVAALAVGAFALREALPLHRVLVAPDGAADLSLPSFGRRVLLWAQRATCLQHDDALKMLLPTLVYHEWSFLVSSALSALALAAYLRVLGLPVFACCGGGILFAFCGYNFTLFSAGHRGYFLMMPYALLMFACIERFLRRCDPWSPIVLAGCAVCALVGQPDVFVFFVGLAFFYGIVRLVQLARTEGAKAYFAARRKGLAVGIGLLVLAFAVLGFGTVRYVLTDVLSGRNAQISAGETVVGGGAAQEDSAAKAKEPWIFATNWSLPPDEVAEFVAPCPRGLDSGNRKAPYWGRIGQSYDWENTHQGFPNFRQHSVYLGAITVALAVFALIAAFGFVLFPSKPRATDEQRARSGLVFFWAAATVVCIFLAFGRYTPVYKLFYAIPMMDKIRCPVKFVHLVEVCVSILAAFGLAWLRTAREEADGDARLRGSARVSLGVLAVLGLSLFVAAQTFDPASHAATWQAMGLLPSAGSGLSATLQKAFADRWRGAFEHGALFTLLTVVAIALSVFAGKNIRPLLARVCAWALIVVGTLDLAVSDSRFVQFQDESFRFSTSPLTTPFEKAHPQLDGWGYSYLFLTQQPYPDQALGLFGPLSKAGIWCADPVANGNPEDYRVKCFQAFGNDHARRWAMEGVGGVYMPAQAARQFVQGGIVRPIATYDLVGGHLVPPKDVTRASVYLAEPLGVPPSIAVYHNWTVTNDTQDAMLAAAAAPSFHPMSDCVLAEAPSCEAVPGLAAEPAEWVQTPIETDGMRAVIRTNASKPGVLVIRQHRMRSFSEWIANVTEWPERIIDETSVKIIKANGIFHAVEVPAGSYEVQLRPVVPIRRILLCTFGFLVLLAALVLWCRSTFRSTENPA